MNNYELLNDLVELRRELLLEASPSDNGFSNCLIQAKALFFAAEDIMKGNMFHNGPWLYSRDKDALYQLVAMIRVVYSSVLRVFIQTGEYKAYPNVKPLD